MRCLLKVHPCHSLFGSRIVLEHDLPGYKCHLFCFRSLEAAPSCLCFVKRLASGERSCGVHFFIVVSLPAIGGLEPCGVKKTTLFQKDRIAFLPE